MSIFFRFSADEEPEIIVSRIHTWSIPSPTIETPTIKHPNYERRNVVIRFRIDWNPIIPDAVGFGTDV